MELFWNDSLHEHMLVYFLPSFSMASTQTLGYISGEYVAIKINVDVLTRIIPLDS